MTMRLMVSMLTAMLMCSACERVEVADERHGEDADANITDGTSVGDREQLQAALGSIKNDVIHNGAKVMKKVGIAN